MIASQGESIPTHVLIEFCRREAICQRLPKSDEEDVVQEALTECLLRSASVENPLAYLRVVIRRIARSIRQASRRVVAFDADFPAAEASSLDPSSAADSRIETSRLLGSLSPRDRRFLLLTGQGYTCAEIGQALGVSGGAARARIFRLRKKLSAAA